MQDSDAVIVKTGMMTSVGLSTPEVVAAVSADVMRFQETGYLDKGYDPFKMALVPDDAFDELIPVRIGVSDRHVRMLKLAKAPLQECLTDAPVDSVPLHLALPSSERKPLDPKRFLKDLAEQTDNAFSYSGSTAVLTGRAAGLTVVAHAADIVSSGQSDFALAGGVDSYLSLSILATLDLESRTKSIRNLDGFIPGEGAGFVLLARREAALAKNLTPLLTVKGFSKGNEQGHIYADKASPGESLATIIREVTKDSGPVGCVYSSMNGEHYWAKEWGIAFMRNQNVFAEEFDFLHPADCFGDTGAAAGPIMLGLAAHRHSGKPGPTLIYCSSDYGPRSTILLSA